MENAQKALMIAASTLVAIMVIGIFVYVFRAGGEFSANYDKKQLSGSLELFNSRFEVYNKADNSIMDLVTVCNQAYNANVKCNYDPSATVRIEIDLGSTTLVIPDTPDKGSKIKKNEILVNENDAISIYDLCDKTIKELKDDDGIVISGSHCNNEKLNSTYLGLVQYKETVLDNSGNNKTIERSKESTIYKNYFTCSLVKHHINDKGSNGQISEMKFEIKHFPEGSDKHWTSEMDKQVFGTDS